LSTNKDKMNQNKSINNMCYTFLYKWKRYAGTVRNAISKVVHGRAPRKKLCVEAYRSVPRTGGIYPKTNQSTKQNNNIFILSFIQTK
jgi:hypothetical protein